MWVAVRVAAEEEATLAKALRFRSRRNCCSQLMRLLAATRSQRRQQDPHRPQRQQWHAAAALMAFHLRGIKVHVHEPGHEHVHDGS